MGRCGWRGTGPRLEKRSLTGLWIPSGSLVTARVNSGVPGCGRGAHAVGFRDSGSGCKMEPVSSFVRARCKEGGDGLALDGTVDRNLQLQHVLPLLVPGAGADGHG